MSVSGIIAPCGLDCGECRIFKATQMTDAELKKEIARRWSEELKVAFTPEDVECNGCTSSVISGWCRKICKVRPCAQERGVKTCAHCSEYQCEKLKQLLLDEPVAKKNLEEIRRTLQV